MNIPQFHLLVVDDDSMIVESLKMILPKNWRMTTVAKPELLDSKLLIHAAFVDMHLTPSSKAEGPDVIAQLSQANPGLDIVAMSGDLSIELMEKCLKNGAQKYLAKPLLEEEVLQTLAKIEAHWMMKLAESRSGLQGVRWIGNSPASQKIKKQISEMRGEPGPLLIEGETGTGKEITFKLLNQQEQNRPFVAVNVAGISENLFESEMFGHVKGAFTGADALKVGLTEAAHGGDLFLDEIEALSLANQVKLLRFLETGEVRKVGSKEMTHVKTRVIVATNQNLNALVKEGKFREDLLFRISGKTIKLPPLRERPEDIENLLKYFSEEHRPRKNKTFLPEAVVALQEYSWPGNVRELKRICEQLLLASPLPAIRAIDVKKLLLPATTATLSGHDVDFSQGFSHLVENFESQLIQACLERTSDVDEAAALLKVSRSNLYKKIKDYNIEIPSPK